MNPKQDLESFVQGSNPTLESKANPKNEEQTELLDKKTKEWTIEDETPSRKRKRGLKRKKGKRRKIEMEFIENKTTRLTTFHKRKEGILKKAYELGKLTGSEILLLIMSETGQVYIFTTKKMKPMISSDLGKSLLEKCLNSPEPNETEITDSDHDTSKEETDTGEFEDSNEESE